MSDVRLVDGDLPVVWSINMVEGIEEVRQRIQIAVGVFLGEWLLDTDEGHPFLEWLTTKPPPLVQVQGALLATILAVEGVSSATGAATFDLPTRTISYTGSVSYDEDLSVLDSLTIGGILGNSNTLVIYFGQSRTLAGY